MVAWSRRHDASHRLEFVPSQEAPAAVMTPELARACETAVHVITADQQVLKAGRAVLFVLGQLGFRRFERVFSWPPLLFFVELGYALVANNRVFFSKLLFTREKE